MEYKPRIVDKEINEKLSAMGAILIRGPKWCGKTTTAKQFAKSILDMQAPDLLKKNIQLAKSKPSLLLNGDKPRLIDEWQVAPILWNAVRHDVDLTRAKSQYILTGSATPVDDPNMHSGVGRFDFVDMKTMTLFESGESTGKISLKDLFTNKADIDGQTTDFTYEKLAYILCRGGWPSAIDNDEKSALRVSKGYVNVLCDSDISKVDNVDRNPLLARHILKAYARAISTIDSDQTLIDDIKANYSDVSDNTIRSYIKVLKRLFVIDEITAWNPNIRSKTAIRSSAKKSMVDPSLATAVLECSPEELMMDINTYGLLFENLVARDLSVYVKKLGGYLNHYRDRYGLECDLVIHLDNGKYALVEVKLSDNYIEEAEKHLLKLRELIKENKKLKEPEFLMVVTATDMAYSTENGVLVVPVGCLRD